MVLNNYKATFRNRKTGRTWTQILRRHRTLETARRYAQALYGVGVTLLNIRRV